MQMLPQWMKITSSLLLITIISIAIFLKREKEITDMDILLKVPDIICTHCVKTINSAISKLDGVQNVSVNLKTKEVRVKGDISREQAVSAIRASGYSVEGE